MCDAIRLLIDCWSFAAGRDKQENEKQQKSKNKQNATKEKKGRGRWKKKRNTSEEETHLLTELLLFLLVVWCAVADTPEKQREKNDVTRNQHRGTTTIDITNSTSNDLRLSVSAVSACFPLSVLAGKGFIHEKTSQQQTAPFCCPSTQDWSVLSSCCRKPPTSCASHPQNPTRRSRAPPQANPTTGGEEETI